jgi:hypothetical protein
MPLSLGSPRFLYDLPITFFIERRTTRGKLPQGMILLPHQVRAKRECLANTTLIQLALL